jgi:hypothetical protein
MELMSHRSCHLGQSLLPLRLCHGLHRKVKTVGRCLLQMQTVKAQQPTRFLWRVQHLLKVGSLSRLGMHPETGKRSAAYVLSSGRSAIPGERLRGDHAGVHLALRLMLANRRET